MPADRSTGVQQALVAYKHRYCGGRVHLENRGEGEWYLAAVCDRCGDTDGLDLEAVRVVEAVSPEPREQDARGVIRGSGTPQSPLRNPRAHEPMLADNPSVASVLRFTASRLRDPEYHWYEHAAVTLERLAEKLEKDYALAEARGFTDAQVERLAGVLWAYEGDPAVDWKGVADPQFGRQGEAVRLRRKAETLLRAVLPKPPPASSTDLPTDEEDR